MTINLTCSCPISTQEDFMKSSVALCPPSYVTIFSPKGSDLEVVDGVLVLCTPDRAAPSPIVDHDGSMVWHDGSVCHREDGPALIYRDYLGSESGVDAHFWYQHGRCWRSELVVRDPVLAAREAKAIEDRGGKVPQAVKSGLESVRVGEAPQMGSEGLFRAEEAQQLVRLAHLDQKAREEARKAELLQPIVRRVCGYVRQCAQYGQEELVLFPMRGNQVTWDWAECQENRDPNPNVWVLRYLADEMRSLGYHTVLYEDPQNMRLKIRWGVVPA